MEASAVPAELVVLAAAGGLVLLALACFLVWPRKPRAGKAAALRFVGGPLAGQSFALDAEVTTVGSVDGATIVVHDRDVARKHVGIRRHAASRMRYELADLGSIHGVSVNGQRMAKRVLASGDIIRLGTSEMVFRIEKVG